MATTAIDQSRLEAFMGQAVVDLAASVQRAARSARRAARPLPRAR